MRLPRTKRCRIAVSGVFNSGKTVFLTSLINHLKNNSNALEFDVSSNGVDTVKYLQDVSGENAFPYERNRVRLGHAKRWPEKTTVPTCHRCYIKPPLRWRDGWTHKSMLLELHDFPGERFADTAMYKRSFAEWSKEMLEWCRKDPVYEEYFAGYLGLQESGELEEEVILKEYKRLLAELTLDCKSFISPSTFLLDLGGERARKEPVEEIVQHRHVGIDKDNQFAPLSATAIANSPVLAEKFEERFKQYQSKVVHPLIDQLRQCDRLAFLVDIPAILSHGSGMLHDCCEIINYFVAAASPGSNWFSNVARDGAGLLLPANLRPGGIRKMCFVASKMDLMSADDEENAVALLKEMTFATVNALPVEVRYVACSAVVSTRPQATHNGQWLIGNPIKDKDGRGREPSEEEVEFQCSSVPAKWPSPFPPGRYSFPAVYPRFPEPAFQPPRQKRLDEVFKYLIS